MQGGKSDENFFVQFLGSSMRSFDAILHVSELHGAEFFNPKFYLVWCPLRPSGRYTVDSAPFNVKHCAKRGHFKVSVIQHAVVPETRPAMRTTYNSRRLEQLLRLPS